jgi:hypothetical protein
VHGLGVNHQQANHAVAYMVDECTTTVASISNATPIGGQMDPGHQALPFGEGLWAVPLAAL